MYFLFCCIWTWWVCFLVSKQFFLISYYELLRLLWVRLTQASDFLCRPTIWGTVTSDSTTLTPNPYHMLNKANCSIKYAMIHIQRFVILIISFICCMQFCFFTNFNILILLLLENKIKHACIVQYLKRCLFWWCWYKWRQVEIQVIQMKAWLMTGAIKDVLCMIVPNVY